jgi:phospholipase C
VITRRRFLAAAAGTAVGFAAIRIGRAAETPIRNVVLLMQENRSFDHYYGLFPGAEGLPDCAHVKHAPSLCLSDPPHDTDSARAESTGGRDNFELLGGGKAVTYYTGDDLPYYWALAHRFTLCDHYFCAVLGPTFPNRLFSIAASAGGFQNNPTKIDPALLPRPNLVDRLDEAKVDWACYSPLVPALDVNPASRVNPIAYYPDRARDPRVNRSYQQFLADAAAGRLPAVSWVITEKPLWEHPPDPIDWGERFAALTINSVAAGPQWPHTAIVFNYDENGGFYDHVAPPQVDERGYGFRVPCIVASPYSKPGHISSETYDHTSVIAFIEKVFGLRSLGGRAAKASPLEDCFDFSRSRPSFVAYSTAGRRESTCGGTPQGWSAELLGLPVPGGEKISPPAARPLCRPATRWDPGLGAAAGVVAGGVTALAARSGTRIHRPRGAGRASGGRDEGAA